MEMILFRVFFDLKIHLVEDRENFHQNTLM